MAGELEFAPSVKVEKIKKERGLFMFLIGLTGGIASGKSTVTNYLKAKYNVKILDADKVVKELSKPQAPIWQLFVEHFGANILYEDKTLNKDKIAQIVFQNTFEREWVNQNTHPLIKSEFIKEIAKYQKQGEKILILDVPLLFEAKWDEMVDSVWVVQVNKDVQEERLIKRNSLAQKEARGRIKAQMPLSEKCRRADVIIDNNGSPAETYAQIDFWWHKYKKAGEYCY